LSYEVQIRRAAELDVAEAQLWYESQRNGLGAEFHSELSQTIDHLAQTPLIYEIAHRDIRRAIVHRFSVSHLVSSPGQNSVVLACTHVKQDPERVKARL